jgi:hypothetical protein
MQDWPRPKTLKSLRCFLGLTGYYRKFVKNYEKIAAPLISLLKNNYFNWNHATDQAFHPLKEVMCITLFLSLPDFKNTFVKVLECDAFGKGIGAFPMQQFSKLHFQSSIWANQSMKRK